MIGLLIAISSACSKEKLALPPTPLSEVTTAGVASKKYLWINKKNAPIVITVKFLEGGSDYLRAKVQEYAKNWEEVSNFQFDFVGTDSPAVIRISFDKEAETRVLAIGTYLLDIDQDEQYNMHYANLNDTSPEHEIRGSVQQLFGYAIGLMPEKHHPKAPHKKDFASTHYKKLKEEESNEISTEYSVSEPIFSKSYDEHSIMNDGYEISSKDKKFVKKLYPFNKKHVKSE